ncbi:hypothetical protein GOEFS_052_00420 [Gordonia effusa NBRC 100432]|uniref:DUF4189 domain-containing protein n=1 Tax=Gordonia effusa NBRC 100432 TaxID=1077974 RepID=H0QZW8_9ACTN|nr:hypothetical protein GOEFS_052_00420 [Gordonia effusa NBRC 100432]
MVATPAQAAPYNWGAIAYDWDGNTATAVDYGSEPAARNAVVRRCGAHCGYFTFYNSCGAVAYSRDGRHSGQSRGYPTRRAAERAALSRVPGRGIVAAYACTTR